MVGPCSSCGPYSQYCCHTSAASGNYYWAPMQQQPQQQQYMMPNNNNYNASSFDDDEADYMYSSSSSSSYSSVDCTLSLGTPSTRLTNESSAKPTPHRNSVSSFCWDLLHPKQSSSSSSTPKPSRSSSNHAAAGAAGGDALFVRRCANCDTTSTPLWRNGPRGPKSLCNACGIRFKKEERRAAAATNTAAANNGGATGMMDPHHGYYNGTWAHQYGQGTPQKMQCFGAPSEYRFIEEDRGSDTSIQFLSWLTHDRPSGLVHDFTR